jgi:hypothetical protein
VLDPAGRRRPLFSTEEKLVGTWQSDVVPFAGMDANFYTGVTYRIDLYYTVPRDQPDARPALWGQYQTRHQKTAAGSALEGVLDAQADTTLTSALVRGARRGRGPGGGTEGGGPERRRMEQLRRFQKAKPNQPIPSPLTTPQVSPRK